MTTTERFKQSTTTALLIGFLSKIDDRSATLTYAQLSEVAHLDVQHKGYTFLKAARERLWRDHKKYFVVITDVGLKLATDAEVSSLGVAMLKHSHKGARVTRQRMTLVNLDKLSNRERLMHMTTDALLGLQEQSTRPIVQKRLEAEYEKQTPKSIEAQELLKLAGVKTID